MTTLPRRPTRLLYAAFAAVRTHRLLVTLTFELFWIVVFLLSSYTSNHSDALAQFTYSKY